MSKYYITGGLTGPWNKKKIEDRNVPVSATMNGDKSITFTSIGKTPSEMKKLIAARDGDVCLMADVLINENEHSICYIPLRQIVGENYRFAGVLSNEIVGLHVVCTELTENEQEPDSWVATGELVTIPTE